MVQVSVLYFNYIVLFCKKGKYLGYIFSLQTAKIALINKLSKHFILRLNFHLKIVWPFSQYSEKNIER